MRTFLILIAVAACSPTGLFDLPEAALRPITTERFEGSVAAEQWPDQVHVAVESWNNALVEAGCDPVFRIIGVDDEEQAYPVTLRHPDEWTHGEKVAGRMASGHLGEGWIDVRANAPMSWNLPVLIHELGHALGLEHDEGDSALNAMVSNHTAPTAHDVAKLCI